MFRIRIVELRNANNLTQQDVADALNMPRTTYAGYENTDKEPDYDTLVKIANFYKVTTDYLLGNEDNTNFIPPELLVYVNDVHPSLQRKFWDEVTEFAKYISNKYSSK
ncbi:helix-turn-helix transcriptional regulator [Bacillus sp. RG28]|uniref:Helix-turn-helix transcriptional regulator n=1 Tax=Gottfriedia endophytica TaxID=2820819 RepID=A0A940NRC5_9BACI|nr:helix-turn-helix transcriptional regulator [Gottfriedia endophytica]MBP0725572.1 helix-turn-helix transcriptional regulator [Gottfriedia endophytica]